MLFRILPERGIKLQNLAFLSSRKFRIDSLDLLANSHRHAAKAAWRVRSLPGPAACLAAFLSQLQSQSQKGQRHFTISRFFLFEVLFFT